MALFYAELGLESLLAKMEMKIMRPNEKAKWSRKDLPNTGLTVDPEGSSTDILSDSELASCARFLFLDGEEEEGLEDAIAETTTDFEIQFEAREADNFSDESGIRGNGGVTALCLVHRYSLRPWPNPLHQSHSFYRHLRGVVIKH